MIEILGYKLIAIGKYELTVGTIVTLLLFFVFIYVLLRALKQIIYSSKKIDPSRKYSLYTLNKYFILVLTALFGLQIVGVNLSILLAGSAALLVGLGLGIQNLFSDYISGIIVLFDSSVKVGDIIDVNGLVCKVQEINLRNTLVLTRDDKYILLPNTDLTRHQLINWTHQKIYSRFDVSVGVAYSSNVPLVMQLLKTAASEHTMIMKTPEPIVRLDNYGQSAIEFKLLFWVEDVFRVENVKSEVRIRIFELFQQNQVEIPFPQRVIHQPK